MKILSIGCSLLLAASPFLGSAATYYVAISGHDANSGVSASEPFRTVQQGVNAAIAAGDTVVVMPGRYDEYVATKASGSAGRPITIRGSGTGEAILQGFRFNGHQWVVLDGITITKAQNLWNAFIRIEPTSHNSVVKNCLIRDAAAMVRSDWRFDASDNSISAPGADWAGNGFQTNTTVYAGACSVGSYLYANHDRVFTITRISGDKAYVKPDLYPETRLTAWAPIFAGSAAASGVYGIKFIATGGLTATNCALLNNTISNIFGVAISLGDGGYGGTLVQSNRVYQAHGWSGIEPHGNNQTILDNWFIDHANFIHWAVSEGEQIYHPPGTGWYDFYKGFIHTVSPGTNVVIARNWFEDLRGPLGQLSEIPSARNWRVESNVVVAAQEHVGCGINDFLWGNNTFYRVSYDENRTVALALGGDTALKPVTNMWVKRNAFIDCGSHSLPNQETGYNLINFVSSGGVSNWVCGPETTGWRGSSGFTETTGFNGGNPLLRDARNPRGADGIPFTADDGLRPLPSSPLALYSLGALPPVEVQAGVPVAYFTAKPAIKGWHDALGQNFDTNWIKLAPFERTDKVRPWTTPEVLGRVPCAVTFDATHSIGALNSESTNYVGITNFVWDFGDGATWTTPHRLDGRTSPMASHIYYSTGTFNVTLTVENFAGNKAVYTNVYRVLDKQVPDNVYHVSPSGNDATGNGSQANPWRTLAYAYGNANLNENAHIVAHRGVYNEWLDCTRTPAAGKRIHIVGLGAAAGGVHLRTPNHTVRGWHFNGNLASIAVVYLRQGASGTVIAQNTFLYTNNLNTVQFDPIGGPLPENQQQNCVMTNNVVYFARMLGLSGYFTLHGRNHLVADNYIVEGIGETDFVRPFGEGHVIRNNYLAKHGNGGSSGHTDFFQWFGFLHHWFTNIVIEHNTVIGDPDINRRGAICQLQQYDTLQGFNSTQSRQGNIRIRNNIFYQLHGASQTADGLQWHNNLFYQCATNTSMVIAGGSEPRGTANNTVIKNNIFFECGTGTTAAGWYGLTPGYSTLDADYNFVCGPNGAAKLVAPPDSLTRWASYGWEANGINGGWPGFVNAASFDFRLQNNSILLSAGTTLGGFSVDASGASRPVNAWSIGPFESVIAGPPSNRPPPPQQLRIRP